MKLPICFFTLFIFNYCIASPVLKENAAPTCGYDVCTDHDLDTINIHLVPHSHDDVGWLNTVQEYFDNSVNSIITTVVEALKKNRERRFIQVETEFLKKWWLLQNDDTKNDMRMLINEGRLQIANGAWSSNDEANVLYQSTIDQFTSALRFLNDNLGECANPKVSWSIDPFGHSREHASLSAQMGFDGVLFARIDYRDRQTRKDNKTLDLMWRASPNLGSSSDIFASILHDHYSAPEGFGFDEDKPQNYIDDDPNSETYNVKQKVDDFVKQVVEDRVPHYPTPNILVTLGDDFQYTNAEREFSNIDKLIKAFRNDERIYNDKKINVFYSTPACYVKAVNDYVNANNIELSQKTDDFFPYATGELSYFTGFFSSKPNSKKFERFGNNLMQVTKQLSALSHVDYDNENLAPIREAIGVMQHHDAITGTEKVYVMDNYHVLLHSAMVKAADLSSTLLANILKSNGLVNSEVGLTTCLLANVSSCDISVSSEEFKVVVYNPYSHSSSHFVQIPVNHDFWEVKSEGDTTVPCLSTEAIRDFSYITDIRTGSRILSFLAADIPALGLKVYHVKKRNSPSVETTSAIFGYDNTYIELNDDGFLTEVTINGITVKVKQEFLFYESDNQEHKSGAWIFTPEAKPVEALSTKAVTSVIMNEDVVQIRQEFNDWITQVIRVYRNEDFIEFDWVVGPIERLGQEVITRFTTNLTNAEFYTDANGREMLKRVLNTRSDYEYTNEEPIAGNYYPIPSKATLRDEDNNIQLSVINDRPQGGASFEQGQLEFMVHRRCKTEDILGEILDEQQYGRPLVIRGNHYLTVGKINAVSEDEKSAGQVEKDLVHRKILAPWVFVSTNNDAFSHDKVSHSLLRKDLPENVQLLTLEPWQDNVVLIRFEHIFDKNMGESDTDEVSFTVGDLFTEFDIIEIKETTLAANVLAENNKRLSWPGLKQNYIKTKKDVEPLTVTLNSMKIKTYLASIRPIEK